MERSAWYLLASWFRFPADYIKYERPLMYATLEATPEIYVPEAIEHLQFIYQDC